MSTSRDYCHYCWGNKINEGEVDWCDTPDTKPSVSVYDNHGYFVFKSCEDCDEEQRAKYDPIIFNDYQAYERKVLECGDRFE
tara:strand:+ start:185 stop:430 length:246 start_codon:yes stop_codon:yes gene_type:complete